MCFQDALLTRLGSLIAKLVKNPPAIQETPVDSWVWEICWRRDRLPTPVFLGFPCGLAGKEPTCNAGDLGSTWVRKSPWRRAWQPTPVFWPGEFHGLYRPWSRKVRHNWATFTFTFLVTWNTPQDCLSTFPMWPSTFCRANDPRGASQNPQLFYCLALLQVNPTQCERGLHQGMNTIEGILEAGNHNTWS